MTDSDWAHRSPMDSDGAFVRRRLGIVAGAALATILLMPAEARAQSGATTAAPGTEGQSGGATAVPVPPVTSPNYVIGPNDRLRITIVGQSDMPAEYVVSGDGTFTYPFAGQVKASGLSVAALEAELRRLLVPRFFRNPQITVSVTEYRSKEVYVMGAVRNPGTYALQGDLTLVAVLGRAGGQTTEAADYVQIMRAPGAKGPVLPGEHTEAIVTRINIDGGHIPIGIAVQDGDTVYVPPLARVFVSGEVRSPGQYPVKEGMTVLQVLSLAGGVTEFGAQNRMKVQRKRDDGTTEEMSIRENDVVRPGDTIIVPGRFL